MKDLDLSQHPLVRRRIREALAEDVGSGDVTTRALVPPGLQVQAEVIARQSCVVSGVAVAAEVFRVFDPRVQCRVRCRDGCRARRGDVLLQVKGPARAILTAERTALNIFQRLCGIATLTRQFVDRVRGLRVTILDTRKTTPGWRLLEKYAVVCGGGRNHRQGLYDAALVKDNHRRLWGGASPEALPEAITRIRKRFPGVGVEVEVENEGELRAALAGRPDWILLDNMSPAEIRRSVRWVAGRCRLEASGGINLSNVRRIASTGVDAISVGRLTHSAPAVDLSLEVRETLGARWTRRSMRTVQRKPGRP